MFTEDVIEFGSQNKLVGIITKPEVIDTAKPAVIILNSGALHRVGVCRSAVNLARSLAEHGFCVFRFDLFGIGDSGHGSDLSDNPLHPKTEIIEALDEVSAQTKVQNFVLHGLCSGARDALAIAVKDERVIGLSMIDGYAYRNLRFFLNKLPAFLLNPKAWINFIRARLISDKTNGEEDHANELIEIPVWPDYPPKDSVEAAFGILLKRRVKILVTYTGSWSDEYNYEQQFFDMFSKLNFEGTASVNFLPESDHVMTDPGDRKIQQDALLDLLGTL